MTTDVKIIQDEREYVEKMKLYFLRLKKQAEISKSDAKIDAVKALKETGVIR